MPHMENGSFPKAVRQMRQDGFQINQITADLLMKRMPALDMGTARGVTERFDPFMDSPAP